MSLYATDLDWTLIFSARALRAGAGTPGLVEGEPGPLPPGVVPVERYEGRDISFMSRRQRTLLAEVERRCLVVPVTTRTLAQYRRVRVWEPDPPAWAVVANGGILLQAGVPDPDWTASVRAAVAGGCREIEVVSGWLAGAAGPWIDRVRVADDLFLYTLVDRAALPDTVVADLDGQLAAWGWELSIQGRKLYAVPAPLRKSAAVREVARRAGAGRVLAAGDSLLDREMLADADVALRPAHGELHELGVPADVVTASNGVAAGEELLAAVLARLGPPSAAGPPAGDEAFQEAGGIVPPAQHAPLRAPPA